MEAGPGGEGFGLGELGGFGFVEGAEDRAEGAWDVEVVVEGGPGVGEWAGVLADEAGMGERGG